ncbi:hypothetical protein Leryth_020971 [Lithospermum erythrorhizon]|nr:hypothetical protein Leryth_020971 [Lithospermum erythrorhizon]
MDKHCEDSSPNSASGVIDQTASNPPSIRDETSREVDLRFGSFAPDLVNGMKMPPRTSSAPPNPDEQRWRQGHYTAFRPKNIMLPSSFSNRQQSTNGVSSQQTHVQRDVHSHLQPPAVTDTTIPSLSSSGGLMTFPPQQSHISAQYGIRRPQIQAPGMLPISPHVPTPLPVGSPHQVRHPTFSPGLPPMPHGPMNQGQTFNFSPQSVHQFSHQSGSPVGFSPRFPQQHIRNLSPRTAVKITNPNTNEELKLDERANQLDTGSSTPGSHHNLGFQLHPTAYNQSHQTSYFPHVHRAPVILQSPPSWSSSPGSHGMTISSELKITSTNV